MTAIRYVGVIIMFAALISCGGNGSGNVTGSGAAASQTPGGSNTGATAGNGGTGSDGGSSAAIDTTAPDKIKPLTLTVNDTSISLTWTDPADSDFDKVELSYSGGTNTVTAGVKNCTISGLTPATTYSISAVSVDLMGNRSDALTFNVTSAAASVSIVYNIVTTPADVDNIRNKLNGSYILIADINMSSIPAWTPVTTGSFSGILNGNGYSLSKLTVTGGTGNTAIFDSISSAGKILGLHLKNISVTGSQYVGSFAVYNYGLISNCSVSGTVTSSTSYAGANGCVGGLVAYNYGTIIDSSSSAAVVGTGAGTKNVGGIAGVNSSGGIITKSFVTGTVTNNSSASLTVGGIAGINMGSITNCYAAGPVSSPSGAYTGGLIGQSSGGSVGYCYAVGYISGSVSMSGGFLGYNPAGTVLTACYYDSSATGKSDTNGGSYPCTTALMKTQSTFSGWDFSGIWALSSSVNDGYPYLISNPPR